MTEAPVAPRDFAAANTRLPAWPGPVLTIFGFALGAGGAVGLGLIAERAVRAQAQPALIGIAAVGVVMLLVGLVYELIRQLRKRRALSPDRYRGPAVVLLLALAFVLGSIVQIPFTADALALLSDEGVVTLVGSIVLLTSLQVALVGVTWLFVVRPRAIAFAMPLLGTGRLRALGAGMGWGVLAWIVASAVTFLMVLLLERVGVPPVPGPAEQAIDALEPWIVVPAIVVVAPIAEELFFRGVAFNAWLRERGRRFAYIGSAALFATIHVSLVSLLPIFLLGLALAWVYRRTGSLLAPIAMHAAVNGISVAFAMLIRYGVISLPA